PWQLSGGMRQRAALLRTYLINRDLLLLDEPFGALDALTRAGMHEWLLAVWEEARRSVLFVTHDVEEALFLADRVYVMSARPGRLLAELPSRFPRPRSLHLMGDPEFGRAKERLLGLLRGAPQPSPLPVGRFRADGPDQAGRALLTEQGPAWTE